MKQASKQGLLRRVLVFVPTHAGTIEKHRHVIQYIAAQNSRVRIDDHVLPPKSLFEEDQVQLRYLGHGSSAIKALQFVTGVWVNF